MMSKRGRERATPILVVEIVMEILSWLPLKPLARAQLVCKQWREMIQDHQLMEKHMKRTSYVDHWFNVISSSNSSADSKPRYCYFHGCDGLLILKNHTSHSHVLWNPASRLLLPLPSPHSGSYGFALCFVPATRNYRIVSFFMDKASGQHGCQLLTPGAAPMEWRLLEFPELANGNASAHKSVVPAGGDAHFVVLTGVGKEAIAEIVSLDVQNELLIVSHLPGDVFGDVGAARAIDCDGKVGLAVIDKDKQEVQVMVLQDFKKKKWCRNKEVIPLPFLDDEGFKGKKLVPLLIKEGGIWFWLEDVKIFVYTIETRKISDVKKCKELSLSEPLCSYKPGLVTFKDMQADDEVERYRPDNLKLD